MLELFHKVGVKITFGYVLVLGLMIGLSAIILARLDQFSGTVNDLTNNLEVDKSLSESIVNHILETRFYASRYVRTQEQADLDQFNDQFDQLKNDLQRADTEIENPARKQILETIKTDVVAYGQAFTEAADIIRRRQKTQSEVFDVQGFVLDNKLTALRVHINSLNDPLVFLTFGNAQTSFQTMRLNVLNYLVGGDERYTVLLDKNYQQTFEALTSLETILDDPLQRQNATDAKTALDAYYQGVQAVHVDYLRMKELFRTTLDVLDPKISDEATQMANSIRQEFVARNAETQDMAKKTRWILLGATITVGALGLGLGVFLSRRITNPLQQVMLVSQQIADIDLQALTAQMTTLAQGDVRLNFVSTAQPLHVTLQDEVGQMARAFNQIVFRLHEAEVAFQNMANYLDEMSAAAQSVARGELEVNIAIRSDNDVLGNAIQNMLANLRASRQQVQRQVDQLSTLRSVDSLITTSQDLAATLKYLLDQSVAHLTVDAGSIRLVTPHPQTLEQVAWTGGLTETAQAAFASLAATWVDEVITQHRAVQFNDLSEAPARASLAENNEIAGAYYALPLVAQGEVKGVLELFHSRPLTPDTEWLNFLETLAGQAAIAINNAELVRGLEERVALRTAQLEESRRFFESLFTNSPVAIVVADLDNRVTSWNPEAEKLFGYTTLEALGQNIDELVANTTLRDEAVSISRNAATDVIRAFTKRTRKDGSLVDVEIAGVPVVVEGKSIAALAIYHDITELQHARQIAEEATRAKSAFLAAMSHEIRTPMNGVIGMTSLLLDTPLTDEQRDYAETIRNSADALLTVINDILDFSKIEAGRLELEEQPFDVRECVESALDLVAAHASEKGLDLAYLIDHRVPGMVVGDVTRVRQILLNLLSNACKFTNKGEVVVRVQPADNQGPIPEPVSNILPQIAIHFSVEDTGIGIPLERMDRLFQSFSQVDASTTRKYGGTGLGLAISTRLTEMMGGGMWVESEVGKGSTFHFTIQAEIAPLSITRIHLHVNQPYLTQRRVLIVDDNLTNRRILVMQAQAWGMLPRDTASPLEALEWVRRGDPFDVALLDMQMPEMDGVSLAVEIRRYRNGQALPLVMLTSLGRREAGATAAEFAAYLMKPIKQSQLYDTLAKIFDEQPTTRQQASAVGSQLVTQLAQQLPLRILVAEDHPVNQKLALQILKKMGYRADVAGNGLEVLQALERQPYDVVLMDVQMPEMDGLEATRRICQQWPRDRRPRIIAMTANAMQGDREECLAAGMDDYLSKPMQIKDLQIALERSGPRISAQNEPAGIEGPSSIDWAVLDGLRLLQEEGEPDFVQEMIELYLSETPPLLAAIREAITQGNAASLKLAAHTLKGNSKSLGAQQVATLSLELEQKGRSGSVEGAEALLEELEREFERARQVLKLKQ